MIQPTAEAPDGRGSGVSATTTTTAAVSAVQKCCRVAVAGECWLVVLSQVTYFVVGQGPSEEHLCGHTAQGQTTSITLDYHILYKTARFTRGQLALCGFALLACTL